MPASMKSGMVGSPIRRPNRATSPAARNAPPSATSSLPIAGTDDVAEELAEVLLSSHDDEAIVGPECLARLGGEDGLVVAEDGRDRHPGAASDLEVGDRSVRA